MSDKPEVKRCSACGTKKPVSEMKTCMHAQMHRYVCNTKCMNDFYNPPTAAAMSDKPEVVGFVSDDGLYRLSQAQSVMLYPNEHDFGTEPVIRLSDHEAAMQGTQPGGSYQRGYDEGRHQGTRHRVADIQQLEASRAADKARIVELESLLQRLTSACGLSEYGAALHDARTALAQQGKEGGE